jgi:hypothetical protein
MKRGRFALKFAVFAVTFLVISTSAWATILPINVTGTIWQVYGNRGDAPTAVPGAATSTQSAPKLMATDGTFTDTSVNYSATGSGNLNSFFQASTVGPPFATNGANLMSNCVGSSFDSGASDNCYSTVIELTSTSTFTFLGGTTYTLNHDDGAILMVGSTTEISSPSPTSNISSTWTPSANVTGTMTIWYMATNTNPEVLQLSYSTPNTVPEPGVVSLLVTMLMGLACVAGILKKKLA